MTLGTGRDWLLAFIAALVIAFAAWLWKRVTPWQLVRRAMASAWSLLHRRQLAEIEELRKDLDALLSVLDHWTTPGAGDKQRQFAYMAEVLEARRKRGISGASMRVASLRETNQTF